MTVKCGQCSEEISRGESIACTDCKRVFHPPCTKINTETLKKTGSKKLLFWKCDMCSKLESTSASSKSEMSAENSVLEAIRQMRDEMNTKFQALSENLNVLGADIDMVKSDINSLKMDVSSIKTEQQNVLRELDSVKEENSALKSEMLKLKSSVQDLEQYSRVNNLIITGIPVTVKENVYAILANVAEVIGVEFHTYDISIAHRLGASKPKANSNANPPPIVAQFTSRNIKNEWLRARRSKKTMKTTELRGRLPEGDIYVNEHLTYHTRQIFNRARALVRSGDLRQAWTFDCKVFVRKEENGKAIKISDVSELL